MFWNIFSELCSAINKKPNAVCKELGFSNAAATHWKNGKQPGASSLEKIAEYFNVSVDYLLCSKDKKNRADQKGLLLNDKQQKLFNAISNMPDDDIRQALDYIELLKLKRNQKPD